MCRTNQNWTDLSIDTFNNYSNYLRNGTKPMTFMIYFGVTLDVPTINNWFDTFTDKMNAYPSNQWLTIQMGLWFYDVNGNTFDCDIMNGKYDENIKAMIAGFNKLGRPIWLRIGYEFNGGWAKFTPSSYIASYKHITNALRANAFCNKYVATVWDYTADGGQEPNDVYKDWYPGDEYVDWWGVNVFGTFPQSNAGYNSPLVTNFALLAVQHNFPVMIGESTPRQVGDWPTAGCLENSSWANWYEGYFGLINNASYGIQAFCYINWNWATADGGRWSNWGDAQIQDNQYVGQHYQIALNKCGTKCFNAQTKDNVLKRLGIN